MRIQTIFRCVYVFSEFILFFIKKIFYEKINILFCFLSKKIIYFIFVSWFSLKHWTIGLMNKKLI